MKRPFTHSMARLAALVVVGAVLVLSACATSKGEGFAIYLTKQDVPPARMPVLSHVDIAEKPIIAISDVITYNASTHEMTLITSAYERISRLQVPTSGKSFVVCVDKKPIYWGAFWTLLSSASFAGVTIVQPLSSQDTKVVRLELGYPSPSFYGGEAYGGPDPRLNAEVMKSLKLAGKLK